MMGALPKALASRGHRVMVVAPRYANYPEAFDTGVSATSSALSVGSPQGGRGLSGSLSSGREEVKHGLTAAILRTGSGHH